MKMGSLFSGSGGFELAGRICGIEPVWASEIEPFPILVTATRFPDAERFGDIKKMDGGKIPKVDIITGGSPCQDMSIAGQRAGLEGKRSNLFREQIRIIKEMRESDEASGRTGKDIRPRYMVWENVPGAFSSNKGEDFRTALEEIAKIKDGAVSIPMPEKNKWKTSGCIMGDDYSIAWRTLDAQYWGVPQRRKRIYLVADFGSNTAPEILFEQDSLRGDSCKSREKKEEASENFKESIGGSDKCQFIAIENHPADSRVAICEDNKIQTLVARGPGAVAHETYAMQGFGEYKPSDTASSIKQRDFKDATDLIVTFEPGTVRGHNQAIISEYIVRRLTPAECGRLQGFPDGWADDLAIENPTEDDILYWQMVFKEHSEALGISKKEKTDNQIRKWLQNPESDSAKYKMWGNGIALPCAVFVMKEIVKVLEEGKQVKRRTEECCEYLIDIERILRYDH